MATVTMKWFSRASQHSIGGVPWASNTMKVALLDALPNQDTAEYWDDISATEVTGSGWASGGVTLASKTAAFDAGTNQTRLDAANISVDPATVTGVEAIVVYNDTGTDSTSDLWGYGDLDVAGSAENGALSIVWHANGCLTLTASGS